MSIERRPCPADTVDQPADLTIDGPQRSDRPGKHESATSRAARDRLSRADASLDGRALDGRAADDFGADTDPGKEPRDPSPTEKLYKTRIRARHTPSDLSEQKQDTAAEVSLNARHAVTETVRTPVSAAEGTATDAAQSEISTPPVVSNAKLEKILREIYIKPGSVPEVGTGKVYEALVNELRTGNPTKGLYHHQDAAQQGLGLVKLLEADRIARDKGAAALLSSDDRAVAADELRRIVDAVYSEDSAGTITRMIADNSGAKLTIMRFDKVLKSADSAKEITGIEFEYGHERRPRVNPESTGSLPSPFPSDGRHHPEAAIDLRNGKEDPIPPHNRPRPPGLDSRDSEISGKRDT